jgi:hypothetical protein
MVCERTAWIGLIEVRRKFLQKNLKYSGDSAKGSSEVQLNACQGGRGGNRAVTTKFERDKHMLFEMMTLGIARVRSTTPFV